MYQFRKLSTRKAYICTVQFALAFRSANSRLELLLCGYGFGSQRAQWSSSTYQ